MGRFAARGGGAAADPLYLRRPDAERSLPLAAR
jgi:hypothetical protein